MNLIEIQRIARLEARVAQLEALARMLVAKPQQPAQLSKAQTDARRAGGRARARDAWRWDDGTFR